MGKPRGYRLGDNPDDLQRAIDQIVEGRKEKEQRDNALKVERESRKGDGQKRYLAAGLSVVMLASFLYFGFQMGWIRLGPPSALSKALSSPQEATILDLDGKMIGTLPAEIGTLSKLHTLDLDTNKLSSLPSDLGRLTELQVLSLSYNELSALPQELSGMSRLSELSLKANQFSTFPAVLTSLSELRKLDLSNNRLSELPDEIAKLRNLEVLSLRGNSLNRLPAAFSQLQKLEKLDLAQNPVSELPPPESFPHLRQLSLRQTKVDEATFTRYQKTLPKVSILR